jgi:hypothetical protein
MRPNREILVANSEPRAPVSVVLPQRNDMIGAQISGLSAPAVTTGNRASLQWRYSAIVGRSTTILARSTPFGRSVSLQTVDGVFV